MSYGGSISDDLEDDINFKEMVIPSAERKPLFEKPEDLRKFLAANLNIGNSAHIKTGKIELTEDGQVWLTAKDRDGVRHEREL